MTTDTRTIAATLDALRPAFRVAVVKAAGKFKGRHPGFKAPRWARRGEYDYLRTYPSAVDYAMGTFDPVTKRFAKFTGRPKFYAMQDGGDWFLLVPADFDLKGAKFFIVGHTLQDANDTPAS